MKRFKFLINEVQVSVIIDTVILNRINITHNSDVNLDDILTKISEETGIETTDAVIAPPKLDKNITAKMKEFFKY